MAGHPIFGPPVMRRRLTPADMFPAGDPRFRVSYVVVGGVRIRVAECGAADAPTVVACVHGWGSSLYQFRRLLPALAEAGHRGVAIDLPGHGLSDKPDDADCYRLAPLTESVVGVLDALGVTRVALVGHSMGAAVCARIAALYPELVSALALAAPAGFTKVMAQKLATLASPPVFAPLLPRLVTRGVVAMTLRLTRGSAYAISERDVDEYWAPTQFPGFVRASWALLHRFEWTAGECGAFDGVRAPTALVYAGRDRLVPRRAALRYAEVIPGVRVRYVERCGHVIPDEAPQVLADAVLDLVTR